MDDEQLELGARDFLLLDRDDTPDAVGRIHDVFASLETLALRFEGFFIDMLKSCFLGRLLGGHSGGCTFVGRLPRPACPRGPALRGGAKKVVTFAGANLRRSFWLTHFFSR